MRVSISKISPAYPCGVGIQWDVEPDQGVSGNYIFHVDRAGSPEGPWTAASGPLRNTIAYTDDYSVTADNPDAVNVIPLSREVYFRVRAIAPNGIEDTSESVNLDGLVTHTTTSGIVGMGTTISDADQIQRNPDVRVALRPKNDQRKRLLRRKILRDQYLGLKFLSGITVKVLKRKHFGTRCPDCLDSLTEYSVVYQCITCYGTGWVDGYFTPIETLVSMGPEAVQEEATDTGNTTLASTSMRLLAYPKVTKGDIIVETDINKRWIVDRISPSELHRILVHQDVVVNELARHSIEYYLSV